MKTKYLSESALLNMKNYKYVSGQYSPMDYVMTPFWNKAVEFLPMWMAPNLVTLIGFFFTLSSFIVYLFYDLTLKEQLPPYLYLWTSFSLFVYQTLDAIDGKQARRTGTSSPLGQLFDHGCDALSTCLNFYVPMQILKIDPSEPAYFIYMGGLMITFFTANWEEYHMGVLRTSMTILGVSSGLTESQLFLILALAIEGLTGGAFSQVTMRNIGMLVMPSVSETNVQHKIQYLLNSTNIIKSQDEVIISQVFNHVHQFAELRLILVMVTLGILPISLGLINNLTTVLGGSKHTTLHCFEGLIPIFLSILFIISSHSFSIIAWEKPIYVFGSMSFFFSLNCSRIIIATVTKKRYSVFKNFHLTLPMLLGIFAFPLNAMGMDMPEEALCLGLIFANGFVYFWYIVSVIKQITQYLDIYCLTIKKKTD